MIALKKLECIFKEIILKECKTAAVISKIKKNHRSKIKEYRYLKDKRSKSTAVSAVAERVPDIMYFIVIRYRYSPSPPGRRDR